MAVCVLRDGFTEISNNWTRYKFENNFIGPLK